MNDNEILDLCWARSEHAIEAMSEKYGAYCYTVSFNILNSDRDAEECVNDTWLNAWNAIPPNRPSRLQTYLGKITRNLSLSRYRKCSTEKRGFGQMPLALSELEECVSDGSSVEQVVEDKMLLYSIEEFLYALPEQRRNIFIRRYWYLYSIQEIAKAYGMSESKTASLLFRLRNSLKAHLEKEGIVL